MTSRFPLFAAGIALLCLILLPGTAFAQSDKLQFQRPRSQAGVAMFETSKTDTVG